MSDPELVPGTIDIDTNYRLGQPEIHIVPDREKCRDNLVDTRFLTQVVAATFEGLIVSEYRDGAFNYDIRVKSDEESRKTLGDIEEVTVVNRNGSLIPLPELAAIRYTTGPAQLFRKNRYACPAENLLLFARRKSARHIRQRSCQYRLR